MQTVVIAISLVVFIWIQFVASFQGLDLSKRSGWLYGILGFLSGVTLGTAISGDLIGSLNIGFIFAFLTLFAGVMSRRHKQRYGGMTTTKSLMRKHKKEASTSLFAKLLKILFDKHK